MSFKRESFAIRIGFSVATAVLILAGASLNISGRTGQSALLAVIAGLLALGAGATNVNWKVSAPLGFGAIVIALGEPFSQGSGRSIPGFDLYEALSKPAGDSEDLFRVDRVVAGDKTAPPESADSTR